MSEVLKAVSLIYIIALAISAVLLVTVQLRASPFDTGLALPIPLIILGAFFAGMPAIFGLALADAMADLRATRESMAELLDLLRHGR